MQAGNAFLQPQHLPPPMQQPITFRSAQLPGGAFSPHSFPQQQQQQQHLQQHQPQHQAYLGSVQAPQQQPQSVPGSSHIPQQVHPPHRPSDCSLGPSNAGSLLFPGLLLLVQLSMRTHLIWHGDCRLTCPSAPAYCFLLPGLVAHLCVKLLQQQLAAWHVT